MKKVVTNFFENLRMVTAHNISVNKSYNVCILICLTWKATLISSNYSHFHCFSYIFLTFILKSINYEFKKFTYVLFSYFQKKSPIVFRNFLLVLSLCQLAFFSIFFLLEPMMFLKLIFLRSIMIRIRTD